MMKLRLLTLIAISGLIVSLIPLSPAFSQEKNLEGTIGVLGRDATVNARNKAKFFEYSDKAGTAVLGNATIKYDSPYYFAGFLASDPGYDTQHYNLDTGMYGKFRLWADYNEIVHNLTFDAKTFYQGAGSDTLTGTPDTDPNTWTGIFDYSTKRKKVDTGLRIDMAKPFFFNVAYLHEKKEGIRPVGVSTTSSAGASLELPEPINYRLDGVRAEGGYAKNPFFLSFGYIYNQFNNSSQDLNFTTLPGWNTSPLSLPPDNKFYKFTLKGSAKLPLASKFSMNLGDAKTTSDTNSFQTFDGKVDTRNYDFMLTSNPLRFLDTKVYYKYYQRDNRSTGQTFLGAALTATSVTPFFYQTNSYGAEAGFRLPAKLYLNTGYKYLATDRRLQNESDPSLILPYNSDNTFFADLKWTGLNFMSARIGYEGLERSADYRTPESRAAFNRRFAYAAQGRDTVKVAVDLFPNDAWNFGAEYKYKRTNYKDTAVGFTDDTRNAFSFNADYALKKLARFYGYVDYERATLNQNGLVSNSPWQSQQEDNTYGYGLRADLFAIPKKLTFIVQYDYLRSNGSNDYTFFDNVIFGSIGVPAGLPVNIPNWDDYQQYTARLTAVYHWTESLSTRIGYAYSRYKYSDAQLNNYQNVTDGTASNQAFLTGAYSNPSYSANIIFGGVTYQF